MEYGEAYFNYQRRIGAFGGKANLFKFTPFINADDTVLDFGCGGGYLLENIVCSQKAGVEVNAFARQEAENRGLTVYHSIEDVPDAFATVIISNHVLEHVECPVTELRTVLTKLQPGGNAVFVVPHQKPDEAYHDQDVNQHLYTWNPMTFGNLFKAAGFVQIRVDVIRHRWTLRHQRIRKWLGQKTFDSAAFLSALYYRHYQIRAVAQRSND